MRYHILIDSDFTADAVEYIDLWTGALMELKMYSWALLRQPLDWKNVAASTKHLHAFELYDRKENSAQLHEEFGYVKSFCTETKIAQWRNEKVSMPKRWVEIVSHLQAQDCEYKEMAAIVEYILCLPGSTASVERVFAAMNKTWTDEKSNLYIETLKSILTVKVNLKMTCLEFYDYIKTKPALLRQIKSKEKYILKVNDGEATEIIGESDESDMDISEI